MRAVYPDYKWQSSKFAAPAHSPSGYWLEIANQRAMLDTVGRKLRVQEVPNAFPNPAHLMR